MYLFQHLVSLSSYVHLPLHSNIRWSINSYIDSYIILCNMHYHHSFLTHSTFDVAFTAATPIPDVLLNASSLNSLSISWSVLSSADVDGYVVFWSEMSVIAGNSMELGVDTTHFTIPNLLSNTAYIVTVQAYGPLGSTNSTDTVPFYTLPKGSVYTYVLTSQQLDSLPYSKLNFVLHTLFSFQLLQ